MCCHVITKQNCQQESPRDRPRKSCSLPGAFCWASTEGSLAQDPLSYTLWVWWPASQSEAAILYTLDGDFPGNTTGLTSVYTCRRLQGHWSIWQFRDTSKSLFLASGDPDYQIIWYAPMKIGALRIFHGSVILTMSSIHRALWGATLSITAEKWKGRKYLKEDDGSRTAKITGKNLEKWSPTFRSLWPTEAKIGIVGDYMQCSHPTTNLKELNL